MTTQIVKTFTAKVKDEFGGDHPQAVIAVLAWSATSQRTGRSVDGVENYELSSDREAIAYEINFWNSAQTKAQGFRSRPLRSFEDGQFSNVFEVDLDQVEVANVLVSNLIPDEQELQAIKIDMLKRF